ETETVVETEAETVVETEAETVVEPEAETVVVPEPLELGSILWDDEAEELLAELNRPLEAAWAALGAEVHDAPPVHSTPLEIDSDLEVDERPGADAVTQSVGLDAPESADPPGEHQSEPPWRDARDLMELEAETTPMGHVDPDEGYELEAGEPNSTSYVDAVVGTDAPFDRWETLEPDALTPGDAGRADPPDLSFEAAELDTPAEPSVEEMGFSVEPPLVEDELPEPEAEEPVEPDLDASAADDVPYPDRFEYEDAAEGSEAPPVTADLGESYVTAFEGAETEDAGPDAWEDDALAVVEAANEPEPEPEPEPVVEVMPEPEPEPEPVVEVMPEPEPEPQIVFASGDPEIEVLPEPAPDPAGEVEIVDVADDVLPVVKNPFVPPDLPRPAREEAAVAAIEAETLTVEVAPPPDAVPAAPVAFGPNPASATPRADDNTAPFDLSEMEGPFAEQRLTVEEDPEDAFRDWVQSASTGVLKRALPELENRSEDDKALLVIERLARMEDSGVEFKTKLVDSLERLARTGPAVDACLALASALEMQDRRSEAREVYHRLLRLKPGHEEALVALELLGNVAEDQLLEEAVEIRPTPYMPDHVNATDSPGALNLPRATPAPNGHGASNGDADGGQGARPYSGVAGGAEASADFEQLLSEFRAELHHKPGDGNSTSRTELGASLKDMGRLDDAIRELQAAVREPSPPPLAFELLGEAFLEKGQGRIAIRLLEKAVGTLGSTDRELMGVLYQLGTAYEALTDANKALICYERIFSVDIDYRDIQERIIACST
ncbi:MAG: tetratricopeptide repeat protein, partial [Gemmatimonadota bacterium]